MTFFDARAISKAGQLHVRRAGWAADRWFMLWRGTWFFFSGGNPPRPVRAGDYSKDDLLATDWTTVPEPLAACPIDPKIPSTGGGDPGKEFRRRLGLLIFAPGGGDGSGDGFGGGEGGDGPAPLPPPTRGDSVTVTFSGITAADIPGIIKGVNLNRSFTFPASGGSQTFFSGASPDYFYPGNNVQWDIMLDRVGSVYSVAISAHIPGDPSGGFSTATPEPLNSPISNGVSSSSYAYGGQAVVSA